jgi:hypothetical protein
MFVPPRGFSSTARKLGARSRDNLYESELQPYHTWLNKVPRSGLCITPSFLTTFFMGSMSGIHCYDCLLLFLYLHLDIHISSEDPAEKELDREGVFWNAHKISVCWFTLQIRVSRS